MPTQLLLRSCGCPVTVDESIHLMGAFEVVVLAKKSVIEKIFFDIEEMDFKATGYECPKCANHCEVISILKDGNLSTLGVTNATNDAPKVS